METVNTFLMNEEQYSYLKETMGVTPDKFNCNVRYFLHQLLDDPVHAEIPTCIRMEGMPRSKFIKMLIDYGIVSRSEKLNDANKDGTPKTPTMSVRYSVINKVPDELEYKVSKNDFDRRIEKLRRSIFEKNLPPKKEVVIDEEGGGATSACASGQFSQPLFGVMSRKLEEKISTNPELSRQYQTIGGDFDVMLEDGSSVKSIITIQNKVTKSLYHICFDGAKFAIYRDKRNGEPCTHVSYIFDNVLNALNDNGYISMNTQPKEEGRETGKVEGKETGRVFNVTEEQLRLYKEATTTTSVGNYQYDVPFGADSSDEAMKRHNGEDGSVSVNHIDEGKKKEDFFEKHGIKKGPNGCIGFSEKEQKWYGWSHRAIHGFGIGDKYKECYPTGTKIGKTIKTLEQAKEAAEKFAESVS